MQQVKLFKSVEAEISTLEADINKWIQNSGARVLSITGNIAPQSGKLSGGSGYVPSDILVVVLYESAK